MPVYADEFDLFISYSHADNHTGMVSALVDAIKREHATFSPTGLNVFFDTQAIADMHDWELRILKGLRQSKVMLAVLSPSYFASNYCRREWRVYVEHEVARAMFGEGMAGLYYVEVEGLTRGHPDDEPDAFKRDIRRRQFTDVRQWFREQGARPNDSTAANGLFCDARPWTQGGAEILQTNEVRARLAKLVERVGRTIDRAKRGAASATTIPPYNPNFVGRVDDLRKLRYQLEAKPICAIGAVQGIGGMGKTELAFTYAHAFAGEYPGGRYLIPCEGVDDLRAALLRLGPDLGIRLAEEEQRDLDLAAARIRTVLLSKGRCLLLLDNVDRACLLAPAHRDRVLPDRRAIHVLATTRLDPAELADVQCLKLDALTTDDAVRLLEQHRPFVSDEEFKAAVSIANDLGGHALACEVVAVYLQHHPAVTCAAYLQRLRTEMRETLEVAGRDRSVHLKRNPEKLIGPLLKPTLESLSRSERLVLDFAAELPPDSVPVLWLRVLAGGLFPELVPRENADSLEDPWQSVFSRLKGLHLLVRAEDERICRVHRVVQIAIQNTSEPDRRNTLFEQLLDYAISRAKSLEGEYVAYDDVWEVRVLASVARHAFLRGRPRIGSGDAIYAKALVPWVRAARLASAVVSPLTSLGDRPAGLGLARAAHEIHRWLADFVPSLPVLSSARHDLSVSLNILGRLELAEGNVGAARKHYEEEVEICRGLIQQTPQDPKARRGLAIALANLGDLDHQESNGNSARTRYNESLDLYQKLAKEKYLKDWSDGCNLLAKLGRLDDEEGNAVAAREHYESSLQIRRTLAESSPQDFAVRRDLAESLFQIADLDRREGKMTVARQRHQESMEILRGLLLESPHDVTTRKRLALSLIAIGRRDHAEGKVGDARSHYQESVEICNCLLEQMPHDIEVRNHLAVSLMELGDTEDDQSRARLHYLRCLELHRGLAKELPDNVRVARHLAFALWRCSSKLHELNLIVDALIAFGSLALRMPNSSQAQCDFARLLSCVARLSLGVPAGATEVHRALVQFWQQFDEARLATLRRSDEGRKLALELQQALSNP